MNIFSDIDKKTISKSRKKTKKDSVKNLILYNDDYNTFDYVIETLIKVCGHDEYQAEQCTLIAHYNGRCSVKSGTKEKLRPYLRRLLNKGLTAEIH